MKNQPHFMLIISIIFGLIANLAVVEGKKTLKYVMYAFIAYSWYLSILIT